MIAIPESMMSFSGKFKKHKTFVYINMKTVGEVGKSVCSRSVCVRNEYISMSIAKKNTQNT